MTYQLRNREQLMDESLRNAVIKRCKEVLGLILILAAMAAAAALFTYSAEDPGVFTSTSEPVQNLFGPAGSTIVSAFLVIIGRVTWFIPVFLFVWGVRYVTQIHSNRMIKPTLFLLIAILIGAIFAAASPQPVDWPHNFGAGGMLGDAMLSALTYSWPTIFGNSELVVPAISFAVLVVCSLIAFGFTSKDILTGVRGTIRIIFKLISIFFGYSSKNAQLETDSATIRQGWFGKSRHENEKDEWDQATANHNGYEEVEDRSSTFIRILSTLQAFFKWRPQSSFMRFYDTQLERPEIEPKLTRSGMLDFDYEPEGLDNHDDVTTPIISHSLNKKRRKSQQAKKEAQPSSIIDLDDALAFPPPLSLLQEADQSDHQTASDESLKQNARLLESVLNDYKIKGKIDNFRSGPVVTLYELIPEPGLKASRVIGLSDDIARNMSSLSARVSTIPGRNVIGIELPNRTRKTVYLRELFSDKEFGDSKMDLAIALGQDISGVPKIVDLSTMPHLLIAGTTGSGKSVAINTMILSLIFRLPPEECRLIMIDPKMIELMPYDGVPHLLAPVVTDPRKAVVALKWLVAEMDDRYQKLMEVGVRHLTSYNERAREAIRQDKKLTRRYPNGFDENGDQIIEEKELELTPLPFIVVIIEELADLIMVAGKEIEACIQRLSQKARAAGIHLVMATQRPSVDVITGTIKNNFPNRVSFQVSSKIDSRTILDEQGAEQLLGRGDMLYKNEGIINRIHGPLVTDKEVENIVSYLKQLGEPDYLSEVLEEGGGEVDMVGSLSDSSSADYEYERAVEIVMSDRKCSTSYIQRRMSIGYNKAARFVDRMEEDGIVSSANRVGKREILVPERGKDEIYE